MPRFTLGVVFGLLALLPVSAEDWTGKKIKAKDDVKPGKRDGAGLIRGIEVVKKDTELTVKADDGTFLELDGKLGTIFKTEAVLASNDPNALPSDGTTWKAGTAVFEREPYALTYIERRSKDGLGTVKAQWAPVRTPTVLRDGNDGTVLVTDGKTEGWVQKSRLVPGDDVSVWAERRLKANPKDSYVLWVRADTLFEEERYAEAEKDYTAALKWDANSAQLWFSRGLNRGWLSELDGAIADFTEAHRLDPKLHRALANRGNCWRLKRDFAKAEADFAEWFKGNPDDVYWLPYRAEARFHIGEWEKAIADADAALKADHLKRIYCRTTKARSLAKLKRYKEAKEYFEAEADGNTNDGQYTWYAHFLATCADGDYRDGVKAVALMQVNLTAFEELKRPMPVEYVEVFAAAFAEMGNYDEAIEKQKKAIERMKADKMTPTAELKRAEKVLELYEKKKPLRDE